MSRVVDGTNQLRGNRFGVNAGSLLYQRQLPLAKTPRLLAVILAHELLGWNSDVIDSVFDPAASARLNPTTILRRARQWVRAGSLDDISGASFAPLAGAAVHAFNSLFPGLQRLDANKPPEPPPRRDLRARKHTAGDTLGAPRDSVTANIINAVACHFGVVREELLSDSRAQSLAGPRHIGMYLLRRLTRQSFKNIARAFNRRDHTTSLHAVRKIGVRAARDPEFKAELEQLIKLIRGSAGELAGRRNSLELQTVSRSRNRPDIAASSLIGLDVPLAAAPFLRRLHPRLAKASIAMDFRVKDFIAEMIAEAIRRKADLRPLAPHPFRQILACNHLDLPDHLVPHAMFIQHALYDFAALLPTRGSLKDRALVIRQIKPGAAAAGD